MAQDNASLTYTAPSDDDPEEIDLFGAHFVSGVSTEIPTETAMRLLGHPHFRLDKGAKDVKSAADEKAAADRAGAEAKARADEDERRANEEAAKAGRLANENK